MAQRPERNRFRGEFFARPVKADERVALRRADKMEFERVRSLIEPDEFARLCVRGFATRFQNNRAVDFQFQIAAQFGLKPVVVADFRGDKPGPVRGKRSAGQKWRRWFAGRDVQPGVGRNGRIRGFVQELNHTNKTTVILTTHDMSDVERLCKRVVVIDQGRVIYDGSVARLKAKYAPHRVLVVHLASELDVIETPMLDSAFGSVL